VFELRPARLDDAAGVAALLRRCEAVDGNPPLSEFKALRVPVAPTIRAVVAVAPQGELRAIAVAALHPRRAGASNQATDWTAELAVDPAERTVGVELRLIQELASELGVMPAVWAFDATQKAAATAAGLREVRTINQMERSLPAHPATLPEGYSLRSFQAGQDETPWLALNQRVFGDHPEAGAIDAADLALRMQQPWFDAGGFLMLEWCEQLCGFCWTKRHSAEVGEIYMIGLVPEHRGRGLARPLTAAGLDYLAAAGSTEAVLYAEGSNDAAVGLYESMGFEVVRRLSLFS